MKKIAVLLSILLCSATGWAMPVQSGCTVDPEIPPRIQLELGESNKDFEGFVFTPIVRLKIQPGVFAEEVGRHALDLQYQIYSGRSFAKDQGKFYFCYSRSFDAKLFSKKLVEIFRLGDPTAEEAEFLDIQNAALSEIKSSFPEGVAMDISQLHVFETNATVEDAGDEQPKRVRQLFVYNKQSGKGFMVVGKQTIDTAKLPFRERQRKESFKYINYFFGKPKLFRLFYRSGDRKMTVLNLLRNYSSQAYKRRDFYGKDIADLEVWRKASGRDLIGQFTGTVADVRDFLLDKTTKAFAETSVSDSEERMRFHLHGFLVSLKATDFVFGYSKNVRIDPKSDKKGFYPNHFFVLDRERGILYQWQHSEVVSLP